MSPDPRTQYEAERREGVSPPWEDLGPETRRAYETNAPRYSKVGSLRHSGKTTRKGRGR